MARIESNELSSQFVHSNTRRPYTHSHRQNSSGVGRYSEVVTSPCQPFPWRNPRAAVLRETAELPVSCTGAAQKDPRFSNAQKRGGELRKPTPQPSSSNVDPERIPYLISEHLPPRSQAPRWAVLRLTEVRGTFLHRRQAVESTPLPPLLRATGGRADLLGTEPVRFSGPMLRGLHLVKCSSFATVNP